MKIGWLEASMRRFGFIAGEAQTETPRTTELEAELKIAEDRYALAADAHDASSRQLQLDSLNKAQKLTEIGRAVKGVTDRLEDRH